MPLQRSESSARVQPTRFGAPGAARPGSGGYSLARLMPAGTGGRWWAEANAGKERDNGQ